MVLQRRALIAGIPLLPVAAAITAPRAAAATTDLVLNCDTTLGPVMRAAARRFAARSGVRVRVFPTPPGLILPQLERAVQNDLIVTRDSAIAAAVARSLVIRDAPQGAWRNRFVLACRKGAGADALKGRIAVPDPTAASDLDGDAVLRSLALGQAGVMGVIDTDEVADLVLRGVADAGLLHDTDVHAHAGLALLRPVPEAVAAPVTYAITVTTLARRPDPAAFVAFVTSAEGMELMAANGLEMAA